METLIGILILLFSVVIHEVAHGYAALSLGDPTAKLQGRLTLNPLKHLDPIGSIVMPIITSLSGFFFGWAKPVPYNPYNLKPGRFSEALVALAGPASNILLAVVFGLILRLGGILLPEPIQIVLGMIVLTNLVLAIFNLVPVPPLDGSKILFSLLPYHLSYVREYLERYGFFLVILFVFFLWRLITPLITLLFVLLTGFAI